MNQPTREEMAAQRWVSLPRQIQISGVVVIALFLVIIFLGISLFHQFQTQASSARLGTVFSDRPVTQVQREFLRLQIMIAQIEPVPEEDFIFQRELAQNRLVVWEDSLPRVQAPQHIVDSFVEIDAAWQDLYPSLADWETLRTDGELRERVLARLTELELMANRVVTEYEHLRFERAVLLSHVGSRIAGLLTAVFLLFLLFCLIFVFNTYRFIQERRRVEEKLAIYTADLERSNQELNDFTQIVSHDLKAPLRKILVYSDRLQDRYGDVLEERGQLYLNRIQDVANRMQLLIEDLLTYARIGTSEVDFELTDLSAVVEEVLADLEVQINERSGLVEVNSLPTLEANAIQMHQLFQNLIGNALKFQRDEVPPVIKINSECASNGFSPCPIFRIVVSDNGIGFEEKYNEQIFTAFQRLNAQERYAGSGIGLAICRKIVLQHGGTISANGRPNEGATFTINLPVEQT